LKRANRFMLFAGELGGKVSLVLRAPGDADAASGTTTATVTP